ncbi:MAG: thermonuclease family protein [Sneathiellaceae bacterium]
MPNRTRSALAAIAAVIMLTCQSGATADPPLTGPTRIIDGDTFDVYSRSGTVRVRIYGIDTPERGQPGARAATEALRALLAAGPVTCHPRPGEITHGRVVATCTAAGIDVALQLLLDGLAAPWCSFLAGDPLEPAYLAARGAAVARLPSTAPALPRHRCPS